MSRGKKKTADRVKTFIMRDARCPFIKTAHGKCVECEAPMDNAKQILHFRTEAQMEKHARNYCCENYQYCELYRIVMAAKYEE